MKKMPSLIFSLAIGYCLSAIVPSARAGTNASVTINTNTGQLSNLGFSTGGQGLLVSNNATGSWLQIPTNMHLHIKDEQGTTYDFHTNGVFQITGTNGSSSLLSNGNGIFSAAVSAGTALIGNQADITNNLGQSIPQQITNATAISGPFLNVLSNGVVGDGVTDDTANIQRLLNQGGALFFPSNRYYCQELQITNNTTLKFSGAVFLYATGAANTNIFIRWGLNTNIVMEGQADFCGGNDLSGSNRTFTTYAGSVNMTAAEGGIGQWNYWIPIGLRHGIQFNTEAGGFIGDGIKIHGFNGIGLLPVSISGSSAGNFPKTVVGGVTIFGNLCGLFSAGTLQQTWPSTTTNWITNYVPNAMNPEYMTYSRLNIYGNAIGADLSAGNCELAGSILNSNYFAIVMVHGGDSCHGIINDCFINHGLFFGVYALAQPYGEIIQNCQIRGSGTGNPIGIILDDCVGFQIKNNQLDPFAITNVNTPAGGLNAFQGNSYSGTWASQGFSTDGSLLYNRNRSYTVANDSDGQPATLVELGNAGGLTNTFNSSTNALIVGGTNGVTNTMTKFGTAVVAVGAVGGSWTNYDAGGNPINTNTGSGTNYFPLPPGGAVKSGTGNGITKANVF